MIFDAGTLAQLRETQEASMMHECTIETYIVGEDGTISYGAPSEPIHCGFKALSVPAGENSALYDAAIADAELRLPLDVNIGMRDRVTLTKSFDKPLVPVRHFEVCGLPDSFGPSGHVVRLKEIYA